MLGRENNLFEKRDRNKVLLKQANLRYRCGLLPPLSGKIVILWTRARLGCAALGMGQYRFVDCGLVN